MASPALVTPTNTGPPARVGTPARTGPPALRPGSRYPLRGPGVGTGCIDPGSLRDDDNGGVADNGGIPLLRDRVGPLIVGQGLVGPAPPGGGGRGTMLPGRAGPGLVPQLWMVPIR